MARPSQMQLPHHWRVPDCTRNEVGIAENGSAIQIVRAAGDEDEGIGLRLEAVERLIARSRRHGHTTAVRPIARAR